MSKSAPDDYSRINVTDKPRVIRDKIMKAKSANAVYDNTPEMDNLWQIWKACGGHSSGLNTASRVKQFKEELAELIITELGN